MCFLPSSVLPVASIFSMLIDRPPLGVFGVGRPASLATSFNGLALYSSSFPGAFAPFQSLVVVVGQEASVA